MDTNDWLTLLIPIACNGFFIFCFQAFVSHKLKKVEKRRETIFNVINTLSVMVCENYESIVLLINKCSPGYTPVELMKPAPFEELLNSVTRKSVQIYNYAKIHNTILKKTNISIDEFVNAYEQLGSFLGPKINKTLSSDDKQTIFKLINNFKNANISLNEKLEQILIEK
ncbi:MAG: hypothetical protein E7284_10135 [Lachnospiraceae bacterium]|nr:hypothetical protein [Lachnospiraceae bacterium]